MKRQVFLLIISTVLLASCQREQDWEGAPDIKAKVESEQKTRTSLSVDESGTGTIYWNPSDQIDVFFGTKKVQYTSQNASDASTATFKTSASVSGSEVSSTNIWGLYPSNSSSSCNGSSVTTTLPSAQYGVPNTFDKDIFPAVAHSSSSNLQFYNVCGGIKFNLAYDDIKKITFRGNNNEDLAGTVSISFVDNLPKASIVNGVKEITLTPKTGTTFMKGADYYFVLLPGTLSAGFTITFTATDDTTGTLNYTDNPVTIKRSIFGKKGNVDVYAAFADDRQPNNVIYYTSKDGNIVTPYKTDVFGADIVSNEYIGGRGILTFDDAITSIGNRAFAFCSGLTSIDIPNSVTSIEMDAFEFCGLTAIEIPSSVMSIIGNPFQWCRELASIHVSSDNSQYDSRNNCNAIINSASNDLISGCYNTIIPNTVTGIHYNAFSGCTKLVSIEIPTSVESIGYNAFEQCVCLTTIEIPYSVTSLAENPFTGCFDLSSIIVSADNPVYDSRDNCNAIIETQSNKLVTGCKNTVIPTSVTLLGNDAFQNIQTLEVIKIPNSVTSIGEFAFYNCAHLSSIVIPSSVTSIGYQAFRDCSSLECFFVLSILPPSLADHAFYGVSFPIYVPAQSVDAYKSAWSMYADRIYAMGEYYKAVELGLSVKWAACNVGTSSPEEYGDYFAWGETETKTNYDWSTYKWFDSSSPALTKYNTQSEKGTVDNKTVLDPEDDAAYVNWGGSWRIPTASEWSELRNNCTWTWTTQNGVNGYRVTSNKAGYTDKSIFIPAAAGRSNDTVQGVLGSVGYYWSSSLFSRSDYASIAIFNSSGGNNWNINSRSVGLPIRPVFGEFVPVQSVSLNQTSLILAVGASSTLTATVLPSNATEKTVTWASSNEAVVTVNTAGQVEVVSAGTATITAWASDGEHSAACSVTVQAPTTGIENGHDWVDLGLPSGLKWATCNVGTSFPEGRGDFFAWGETAPKTEFTWDNYKFTESGDSWSNAILSKYNTSEQSGVVDNRTELEPDDDAAHINWGGGWRMPTSSEAWELIDNCSWMEFTQNGVSGIKITGKNGNSIFLPATDSSGCFYWCSTLNPGWESKDAYDLYHYRGSSTLGASNYTRFVGLPVRPVRE